MKNNITEEPVPILRWLYIIVGADTLHVITSITGGKPKSVLVNQCFGIGRDEDQIESAPFPDNPGRVANWSIRFTCSAFEFAFAKERLMRNGFRVGGDAANIYVFLGFNPAEMKEGE